VNVRPRRAGEGAALRELARRSKAHWGYEAEVVRVWAKGLEYDGKDVWVAEEAGTAIGYATLAVQGERAELDELWVDPDWIGRGIGSELFRFLASRAAGLGARRLEWEAEPNAVGFYERVGGRYLRDSEPSEWGRILPVMGIDL